MFPNNYNKNIVDQVLGDISKLPQHLVFEGKEKRGCALEQNLFAFVSFEICHVATKKNNKDNATDDGDDDEQKQNKQRFCRITHLELNEGGVRSASNDLPQISAFPLDEDEYEETTIKNNNNNNNKDDDDEKKKETTTTSSSTAITEENLLALTNIELVGCPSGILLWRPGKDRHFFLRLEDGYVISLWTSSPIVCARVIIHPNDQTNTTTGVYFLTHDNTIEGFNLSQVTPMLQARKIFRARLDLPVQLLFGTNASSHSASSKKTSQQQDLSKEDLKLLEEIEANALMTTISAGVGAKNNNNSRNLDASATISQQFSPYHNNNNKLTAKIGSTLSNNNNKMTLNPNNFSFSSSIGEGSSSVVASSSMMLANSLISSPQAQREKQLAQRLKRKLHAASFCEVPAHRLLNIKQNTFLLQIAEAKEVFAFTLPSILAESEDEFEYNNQYEIFYPRNEEEQEQLSSEETKRKNQQQQQQFENNNNNNNVLSSPTHLCLAGKLLRVTCHHVGLKTSLEDVENSENGKKFLDVKKTNSIPIALVAQNNNTNNHTSSSSSLVVPSNHASVMHVALIDVQAGTFCLMLARRGANAVEFFLFSEHCLLRALSPKTISGHHKQLLNDEEQLRNRDDEHNNNNKRNDDNDNDVHSFMFLYHSLSLVSNSAKKTEIRCTNSVENPNFLVLSFSNTNETNRTLNFGVCLPIFDRRRKVWAACAAAQRKLWRGDSIPILGGDPYPPVPMCCPLPSNHDQQRTSTNNSGKIQQNLPGSDQLVVFEYSQQPYSTSSSSSSSQSTASLISFVDWTDLWISTIYSRLDEQGATFTLTAQNESEEPTIAQTTPIIVQKNTNLSTLFSLASKQATAVFAQVRHGVDAPVCPSHEHAQKNLSIFEQNQLAHLEHLLNQQHGATGKRMGEILLTKIDNLAKNTNAFEDKVRVSSLEAHEQFFRNQGVEVIRNTFEQLQETKQMLESLKIGIEQAEEERKMLEEEQDEDHDRTLQELLDRASSNMTP